jgi:hypothetical protein
VWKFCLTDKVTGKTMTKFNIGKSVLIKFIKESANSLGLGIIVGLLGVIMLFRDLVFAKGGNVLWANDFDPKLIYWIVNWGYHVLWEMKQPFEFWNANSFYPNRTTLAYSDSLLGLQFLFIPLRLLGIAPLASLYLSLAGICLIGSAFTYRGLYRTGYFSPAEAVFITFSSHFGLNVINFANHYQLFGFQLAPPVIIYLYLYLRDWKRKDLLVALSLYVIGASIAMYLAPMLFLLCGLMVAPLIIERIKREGFVRLLQRIGLAGIVLILAYMFIFYLIQIRPYLEVARQFPKQSMEETAIYSADLHSLFTGFSKYSMWYGPREYSLYGKWEYAYFPGVVLLSLGLLYFLMAITRCMVHISRKAPLEHAKNKRNFVLYMAILFVASVVLSWGPFYKPDHSIQLPFYYLSRIIPGLEAIRAPGRFGIFISLPLSVFSVLFVREFVDNEIKRRYVTLLLTLLIMVESIPKFPLSPFTVDEKGIYELVSRELPEGAPLLELPVLGQNHIETIKIAMEQLDGSTIHWGKLVVGYGANKITPQYEELLHLDELIQRGHAEPMAAIDFAVRYGISYLLIHLDRYNSSVANRWKSLIHEKEVLVLYDGDGVLFVRLRSEPGEY